MREPTGENRERGFNLGRVRSGAAEVNSKEDLSFDFSGSSGQLLIIETVRVSFLLTILLITLLFQALQPMFVNIDLLVPVYSLLAVGFFLNSVYLTWFEKALRLWVFTAFLFFFEAVFITGLIHYTGVHQSIFLFLYLVNIILCGLIFKTRGAVLLALWTSILFSFLMIIGPDVAGQTLFFAVGLNNLAFFSVAVLSGFLSEQINFMGGRLQAQGKDLRALKNLNSIIIENIGTGLVTIDTKGMILQANRAAGDILELNSNRLVGRPIEEIVPTLLGRIESNSLNAKASLHPFHSPTLINSNGSTRSIGEGDSTVAVDSTKSDGSLRFDVTYMAGEERRILETTVSMLPHESSVAGYIVTFQDLTKVRRLEFQMRQSEKMAAVGGLAAGIAHEIRNPLASISGSIQLLGASFTSRQEEEQRLMKIVLREIDRLNNLITEFLDFVRPDAMKDDPIDVNELLRDVLELVNLNRNLRTETRQVVDLRVSELIAGDRDKLKQALMNIVINAYQAMGDAERPEIEVRSYLERDRVVLKIRDSGCGIDEIGLRKIFEPFHTTKPKGTGLGLAVTHKIIENHGGLIFVESEKGKGTQFTLEFPVRGARSIDKNALADSLRASENFSRAFKGQKRSSG